MKPLHGLLSEVLRIRAPLFHLGPLLARSLQGFHSLLLRLLQGAQVFVQLFEHIRCGLQPVAFIHQLCNFGGNAGPILLVERRKLFETGQRIKTAGELITLFLDNIDFTANLAEPRFQLAALGLQCRDLGAIAPAQYIAAAIINTVTVILFVSATRVFDLARAGDGAGLATELLLRAATRDVKPMGQFAFQPIVVRRVWLDRQLADQGITVEVGQFSGLA